MMEILPENIIFPQFHILYANKMSFCDFCLTNYVVQIIEIFTETI